MSIVESMAKGVFAVLFVALAFGFFFYRGRNSPANAAINACRENAASQLVSPATAEFSEYSLAGDTEPTFDKASQEWIVNEYIDSENSFGALIRSSYTCSYNATAKRAEAIVAQGDIFKDIKGATGSN